jgi:hypothetical protein
VCYLSSLTEDMPCNITRVDTAMKDLTGKIIFEGPKYVNGLLSDDAAEVPEVAGVYVWRRILNIPRMMRENRNDLAKEIRKQAECPLAVFAEVKLSTNLARETTGIRPSYILLGQVKVGSAQLDEAFIPDDLQECCGLADALATSLQIFGPAVYVGQSKNLRGRVRQHMGGQTGLVKRLEECKLTMQDVALYFVKLETASKKQREYFELLLTHLTGAPLSRKAGN